MGTTPQEDAAKFDDVAMDFGSKPRITIAGNLNFAGSYWPPREKHSIVYHDVERAIRDARAMAVKGYATASAAVNGDQAAGAYMTRWFGVRNTGTGADDRDWWVGARTIIGAIENFVLRELRVYYRGSQSLIGQPNDYPGEVGNLKARDIRGYAESSTDVRDNVIGLCSTFFAKQDRTGRAKMNLTGKDTVGGVLVHELSHNICGTEDHERWDVAKDCYGTTDCLALAVHKPSRAWWNADNIEYFCEDVLYDFSSALPQAALTTGALTGVKDILKTTPGATAPPIGPQPRPATLGGPSPVPTGGVKSIAQLKEELAQKGMPK